MAAEDVYRKLRITDSIYIEGDFTVLGNFTFGDAAADSLTLTGSFAQTYTGTNDGNLVVGSGNLTAGKDLVRFSTTGNISSTSNVVAIEQTTGAGTAGAYGLYINCTGTNVEALKVDAGGVVFDETLSVAGASTFSNTIEVTGASTFSNTITVGVDDTGYDVIFYGDTTGKKVTWDTSADMLDVDGIMKVHNRPVSTDTYALEVKCDYAQASGTGQGGLQVSTRIYPTGLTTTINAQGGYSQCQLHATGTMTAGLMTGFLAQAHSNGGTLDGAGIVVRAMHTEIADGGTWTEVSRVCSLHVNSNLSQAISTGTFNLLFIQNSGTTTAADAIAIDGNDKVTALMTLTNVDGAAMVANGSVLNDISATANDGYIKVIVEGETKYIALYDTKA